jgi:23S rRNA (cytidine1920-2'-O)/16S rRNA (cytidine1409-2'-O)-methyltransferase
VAKRTRKIFRNLAEMLLQKHPEVTDAEALIASGRVLVDGVVATKPSSRVRSDASIVVVKRRARRGSIKLRAALDAFGVPTVGRVAVDVGAGGGGFTEVLLDAGARRVYAVDAGYGQLPGSLRQDDRVVVLESVNLGRLDRGLIPDVAEVVTIDLSYLSLARAVPQLESLAISPDGDLIALVKPMFELGLARPPSDDETIAEALAAARAGIETAPWAVASDMRSPARGARGAIEALIHARRLGGSSG